MAEIADILTPPAEAPVAPAPEQGGWVNVLNPEGDLVSIPQDHVQDALNNGFSEASPHLVEHAAHAAAIEQKYGGGKGEAQAFTEGALKGILGPLAAPLERAYGQAPGKEKEFNEQILGHEEANPVASGLGEATGFLGSAVTGLGQAAVLGKAGAGLEAAAGLGKGGRISQIGAEAVSQAFQMGLMQGGEELHKAYLDDPNQTAETAMAHIGASAVLGGIFGGATGAIFRQAAEEAVPFIAGRDVSALQAGDLKAGVEHSTAFSDAEKKSIFKDFSAAPPKENSAAIKSAFERTGMEPLEGNIYGGKGIQMAEDTIGNSPETVVGAARSKAYAEQAAQVRGVADEALGEGSKFTTEQLGTELQDSFDKSLRARYEPTERLYNYIHAKHQVIPLESDMVAEMSKSLRDIRDFRVAPGMERGSLVKQTLDALKNAKDADDLAVISKGLSQPGIASSEVKHMAGILKDELTELSDNAVNRYAMRLPQGAERQELLSLVDKAAQAKSMYKNFIKPIDELSGWLGHGKIRGFENAMDFIKNRLSPTELAKKVANNRDPAFTRLLERHFPEQWEIVKDYQKAALRTAATDTKTESLDLTKLSKALNGKSGLPPEMQKQIFTAEELQKLKDADTIWKSRPEIYNTSRTDHIRAFKEFFEHPIKALTGNARDAAILGYIKATTSTVAGRQAAQLAEATVKGDKAARKAIGAIFNSAKELPSNVIPMVAARAKLDKLVESYTADPSKMIAMNDNNNSVPEYSQAFSASGARIVQFLGALKPKTDPKAPLDSRRPANSVDTATYNRALDIAQQPLTVLKSLHEGRLTSKDVNALATMYPSLYKNLAQKMSEAVATSVEKGKPLSYSTRMGLSLFLGQALDSSMTPASIQAIQMRHALPSKRVDDNQTQGKPPTESSVKGLQKLPGMAQTSTQQREMSRSTGKH